MSEERPEDPSGEPGEPVELPPVEPGERPVGPGEPGSRPSVGGTWEGFGPSAWGPLGDDPTGWGMPAPGLGAADPGSGDGEATGDGSDHGLTGKLLVAAPSMVDPNFARTVVLVLHNDSGGSLGLVLNRPSQLHVTEPLSQWVDLAAPPSVVFVGGPVASAAAICLGRLRPGVESGEGGAGGSGPGDGGGLGTTELGLLEQLAFEKPQGWRPVWGSLGTLDLTGDPAAAGLSVEIVRVFAGYAGWGPGQLTAELGLGGWMVVDPTEADAFSPDPDGLWKSVLRRQAGAIAMLASYPEDPSAN